MENKKILTEPILKKEEIHKRFGENCYYIAQHTGESFWHIILGEGYKINVEEFQDEENLICVSYNRLPLGKLITKDFNDMNLALDFLVEYTTIKED